MISGTVLVAGVVSGRLTAALLGLTCGGCCSVVCADKLMSRLWCAGLCLWF